MPQTAEQQTRLRDFTRRLRDERFGGNDSALARAMGVNQSTVHRFLSGKTIRLDVMEKIAKVAGVKLAVLLDGSPPPLPDNDQEPAPTPAPPPVSRTVTTDFARNDLVNAAYDPRVHVPTDMVPVLDALEVGAPLLKASADPTAYVRRLLDIVAKARKRGEAVTGDELPTLAAIEMSGTLDRAAALAKAEAMAEARSWMRANGIEPPPPGRGLHPALAALAEAPEASGGAPPNPEPSRGKP